MGISSGIAAAEELLGKAEWGTVGEWVSAGGTLLAVLGALYIARMEQVAERKRAVERADEARAGARRERRRHASTVSIWLDTSRDDPLARAFFVFNAGESPITNVYVRYDRLTSDGEVGPDSTFKGTLAPRKALAEEVEERFLRISTVGEVIFTDVSNVRWVRDTEGKLEEVDEAAAGI